MKVNIRADRVEIEGYVNAVERDSKPLMSRLGRFIERICVGAFKKALARANDVALLLNHDWNRQLGSTANGTLELREDSIGLHAKATITDPEVVEDARRGNLVGWSFGFRDRDVVNSVEEGMPLRKVRDLDLFEVSLLNNRMTPAYNGTLVTTRAVDGKEEIQFRGEANIDEDIEVAEDSSSTDGEKIVENSDGNKAEDERSTEVNTKENESQEAKGSDVEKPVEKNVKTRYNKAINIIKKMKEDYNA